jgi:hypothetical protein
MLIPSDIGSKKAMLTAESVIRVSASSVVILWDSDLNQSRCLPLRDGVNRLTQSCNRGKLVGYSQNISFG